MANRSISYSQAISEGLVQSMEQNPNVFIFGIGVDDHKAIFGTTKQAFETFGPTRVFDVPAAEGALTGVAIGAALNNKRPVLVHARNDFMFLALDQMLNNAAKWKYVYAGKSSVPFVVRGIIGKGWGQGVTHSQSLQSIFAHFPGLYVAMPSNPYDVKGIMMKSLTVDVPVVILEHRALYDQMDVVPQEPYFVELGKGKIVREGKDLTIVATSLMVKEALHAAESLAGQGIDVEVIDPISIQPLDEEMIIRSVMKTGRLIVADTSWQSCGFASEVAATVAEKAFMYLQAPIRRITLPSSPCPVSKSLEEEYYPTYQDVIKVAYDLLNKKLEESLVEEKIVDRFVGPY